MSDPTAAATDSQKKLQDLSDAYSKLQSDLQTTITARQRLESQQSESQSVLAELSTLSSSSSTTASDSGNDGEAGGEVVYKLVGPVLVKQTGEEARQAVQGRLGLLGGELKRVEGRIEELQSQSEEKKMEVLQLQGRMQEAGAS